MSALTSADVGSLLQRIASYDGRAVTTPDVIAWLELFAESQLRPSAVELHTAVRRWYESHSTYVRPANLLQLVRDARRRSMVQDVTAARLAGELEA
jgi:hypothetical protein